MKPKKLFRQWQRRRQHLQTGLERSVRQCRRKGEAEQVHALRVTLRRLRLFVRVGRPWLDEPAVARFRVWAHGVSKFTSPVRDLDVAIEWLRTERNTTTVVASLERKRDQLWRRSRGRLQPPPRSLLTALGRVTEADGIPSRFAKRARKLASRYEAAARAAWPRFFRLAAEDQHEFRRTLRWWRYLRELSLPSRRHRRDTLLAALVAAQETTGDSQNLALALSALRRQGTGALVAQLRRQLQGELAGQPAKIKQSLATLAELRSWGR